MKRATRRRLQYCSASRRSPTHCMSPGLGTVQQALARVGWGFAAILLVSGVREVAKAVAWTPDVDGHGSSVRCSTPSARASQAKR